MIDVKYLRTGSLNRRGSRRARQTVDSKVPGHGGGSSSPDFGFNRYSERAKQATFFSRWEASQLGSPTIQCEHLLLGVVHARQDLASAQPYRFAPPIAEIRSAVASGSMVMPALPTTVMILFSDATKIVLGRAAEAATRLGHNEIKPGYLVLALMQSAPSTAASILTRRRLSERSLLGGGDAFLTDG
jgi:ATP-dependent Clp protease ATP-binding subunit ClpA